MNTYKVIFYDLEREVVKNGILLVLDMEREYLTKTEFSIIKSELTNLMEQYNLWYVFARIYSNNSDLYSYTISCSKIGDTYKMRLFRLSDGAGFQLKEWTDRTNNTECVRAW